MSLQKSTRNKLLWIGLPSLLVAALVILSVTGVIPGIFGPDNRSGQRYERPRILTDQTWQEPQTLSEFLNAEKVSLDLLLSSEKLSGQLLAARSVDEVVDSRLSMSNLRSLQTAVNEQAVAGQTSLAAGMTAVKAASADTQAAVQGQLNQLLEPVGSTLSLLQPQIDIKAVWTRPATVLLHWTPHGQWIPDNGYRLYRMVNGQSELLAENLGTLSTINLNAGEMAQNNDFSEYLVSLFEDAALTEAKLSAIGLANPGVFASLVYQSGTLNSERKRIGGSKDFAWLRDRLLAVPATLGEMIPVADNTQPDSLDIVGQLTPEEFSFAAIKKLSFASMALKPMAVRTGFDSIGGETGGEARLALVSQIMDARKNILAKAFTDEEFAAAVGLGFQDDLQPLKLADGTEVTYRLETLTGETNTVKVTTGTETALDKPQGLAGYGMDNVVYLRWQAPVDEQQKTIISGYFIERKKAGEKDFQRISNVPVAISYTLDETGVFFETPAFYQDESLDNNDKATYRIQVLDIFGRTSEYADLVEITVYKVDPPSAPVVVQPALSTQAAIRAESTFRKVAELNANVKGIMVPVSQTSEDTRTLVVYRAAALGAGLFDEPAEIGRIDLPDSTGAALSEQTIRVGQAAMLLAPAVNGGADLMYFDADVKPGYTYKYWAAALDDWGNESVWSASRVQGVPLAEVPKGPTDLAIVLNRNELPDLTTLPAGFGTGLAEQKSVALRVDKIQIGVPVSDLVFQDTQSIPELVATMFGNLPDPDRIQAVVALQGSDLLPDGSARVSWTPFGGDGLRGYNIYRADVDGKSMQDLQAMSRPALVESFNWQLAGSLVQTNQIVDTGLVQKDGRIHLYLVCLVPELTDTIGSLTGVTGINGAFSHFAPGGWTQLQWTPPDDPQIQSYRIYRAEVDSFAADQDPATLDWALIADQNRYTNFTEKVDQTYAHYYYYKVTGVSIWGLESTESAIEAFRVPATSPPQTPAMLLPLAQKGKIQVNWAGVPHASTYHVYRTKLPKIKEEDIITLQNNEADLYRGLFEDQTADDTFLFGKLKLGIISAVLPTVKTPILSVDKFNTLQQTSPSGLLLSIGQVSAISKLSAFRAISEEYGPLALAPYGDLSEAAAKLVFWDEVGTVTVSAGQDPTAAFNYVDEDVVFGDTYLYTVAAENDDQLVSGRPEPVSASPRKNGPFPAVTGLQGSISEERPLLSWNQAQETNLTWLESREFVAGYIVYRSIAENGEYYQASPLVSELSWRDESADASAYNWYKVKVVDTAGYLSEYSAPVLVRQSPVFVIRDAVLPILPSSGGASGILLPAVTIGPIVTLPIYDSYEMVSIGTFQIHDVKVQHTAAGTPADGTGLLSVGPDELIQVTLDDVLITATPLLGAGTGHIQRGSVSLAKAAYLPKAGVTFSKLTITADGQAFADGYLQSPVDEGSTVSRNLIGDLYALRFTNSPITSDGTITVGEMPGFRYGRLVFAASQNARIHLVQNGRLTSLVELNGGRATYHLSLETLDNQGLGYLYTQLNFDRQGQLTGNLQLETTQVLRLVVPAGLGVQASSSILTWKNGVVDAAASSLQGKVYLPFQTFDDQYVSPASQKRARLQSAADNLVGFDRFLPGGIVEMTDLNSTQVIAQSLSAAELAELDESMAYLAERIQGTSLLVLPASSALREKLSTVPFNLQQWGGDGFTLDNIAMTPANVGNCAEDTSDAIGVTPGMTALDLDRAGFVTTAAPDETQQNFWVGIIVKEGRLALPGAYIRTEQDTRASFELSPGELLYDLNGVSYQNLTYNAAGTPANFGEALGGFRDVKIFDCMIDLYGNKVNIEINGEMGIPLFGYQKAKVKLYTSKETGKLVCTVAETEKFDPSGTGQVLVKILNGYLQPDGLHINGLLDVNFPGKLVFADQMFNELIIPADMQMMTASGNPDGHYGTAILDQPLLVRFHDDFAMEIRSYSMLSTATPIQIGQLAPLHQEGLTRTLKFAGQDVTATQSVSIYQTALTLWGGLQLADNLTLNTNEDFDRLVLDQAFTAPEISYDTCKAKMSFQFEEFLSVDGIVTPEPIAGDDGLVEFDMDTYDLIFNKASDLVGYDVDANVRIGYDRTNSRYFFVIGTYYDDPEGGINFYYGKINQITGILGYNVDLPKAADGRYALPKGSGALYQAVDAMQVNRTAGGNYFFASTCNLYFAIGYADISIPICDVRDTYIVVEKGPSIESGGDLYAPLDVEKLITGQGFIKAGYTIIGYYHPERLFQFTSVLYDVPMYTFEISGEVNFTWNPALWDLRIGYPDPLKATGNGIFECGFGLNYRSSDLPDDSWLKAQVYFEYDTGRITISPVYVRAYVHVGAEGQYLFDQKLFSLDAWLNGGAEGGISAFGKHYAIISLMLNANGRIVSDGGDWNLSAQVSIYYSLDLWLDEIEGSVSWHISRSF